MEKSPDYPVRFVGKLIAACKTVKVAT